MLLGCEQVVIIPLPPERNLTVVEGWITSIHQVQSVRLTSSNSFSGPENSGITDADIEVVTDNNLVYEYTHVGNGNYESTTLFQGVRGRNYRLDITLASGEMIQSNWTRMLPETSIVLLSIDDFIDADPDNPGQQKTFYFPRITARDSADYDNFYRWVFTRNGEFVTQPESITLQRDQFFDGNFIPNLFDQFEYELGDQMTVELHAIEEDTYEFLTLLKSQITTLGETASTTPADVNGNLTNISDPTQVVLGYFATTAISIDSVTVE